MTSTPTARLAIDGLSKTFGGIPALQDVSLMVQPGELVSMLGPSGCGKSTTLRLIAGLDVPDKGAIRIDGVDVASQTVPDRNVGLVFQRYALFQHMTVSANIGFGLKVRGIDRAEAGRRVDEILGVVGLEGLASRFPHQLSGGQMQRVALARTLVTQPRVLMLDEPFAALDAELRGRMRAFLRQLQQKLELTTLFVTHDQSEAMELSDRIAVMQGGRLLQVDAPEAIYNRPATPDVARMFGAPNLLEAWPGDLAGLRGVGAMHEGTTIMIRPEDVRLSPGSGPSVVIGVTYLGKSVLYTIRNGQQELRAERPASEPRLAVGQPVTLDADPDAVWHFPPPCNRQSQ